MPPPACQHSHNEQWCNDIQQLLGYFSQIKVSSQQADITTPWSTKLAHTMLCSAPFHLFLSATSAFNELCWAHCRFGMSVQVLVLLLTPSVSAGGAGPPCEIETSAGQRAAGRPAEGQPTGQPDRAQQHRQQLQPERQSHMRLSSGDATVPSAAETLRRTIKTTESWSVASLFTWQRTKYRTHWES